MNNTLIAPKHVARETREEFFEAYLADTTDGFMILDTSLRIIHFSSKYDRYHHLHTGKHLKRDKLLQEVLPVQGMAEILPFLQKAFEGERVKFAIEYPPIEGTIYKYEIRYSPLLDSEDVVIGVKMQVFDLLSQAPPTGNFRTSEDLFKTLILNSTDAFQLTDIDFELQYISETVINVLGYSASELVGSNGLDHVHPDDRDQVREWFKKIRLEEKISLAAEYRIKNKAGNYIWIENVSRNMLHNPNVKAIVMNFRNIQAKKIADFALIQAEQRLSLLLNNTEESFIILNSRLRIVAYNRAAQEHTPYFFKQEIQSNLSIFDMIEVSEVENMIGLFEKVFAGEEVSKETEFAGKKPHIFNHIFRPLFNDQRDIFGVFITSTDITKRKFAEQQVKESETRFKTINRESFDAILIADEHVNVQYVSPSFTNVLGFPTQELIGRRGLDYIHPEDTPLAIKKFSDVAKNPVHEQSIDIRMRNAAGEYIWVEAKAKNMFDNQYVKGILISLRDISGRKKAEEIISLSELRFKGLVQSGSDMISIVDKDCLLQYSSPTFQTVLGIDASSKYGQNIFSIVHADDLQEVKSKFDQFITSAEKQVHIGPYRCCDDDGTFHWIESTITNFTSDPSINGIVFNSRDITERKKLTEDLAANTERLKSAQKIAKLGYFEHDAISGTSFCSDQFYEILGLRKDDNIHLNFEIVESIIHPDDRERFKKEVALATIGVKEFNEEYRIVGENGAEKVVLAMGGINKLGAGPVNKFSLTLQDITESKKAMLELQTMEGRFSSLFENSIDGVIISTPRGQIISANPAICKILGYTQNEMVHLNASALLDLKSASVIEMINAQKKAGPFIAEISIRHKNGCFIPAEITSINMTDAKGNVYHSTIIRDITEKKKIEIEQQSLTQELLKNNQDLQQFSFITSHNLRAPVANLISLLSLYNKQNHADEFNGVLIDKFEEATLQLNQTLNDLIDVLVIKSNTNIEKQTLHFSDIFIEVKKNIDNLLSEQKGVIETDFTAADNIVYNKIHLESIFLNLISNAIRYRSPERNPVIKISAHKKDNWVVVNFEDNGLGIDLKRYGDRMFGLYQRFHTSKEGKGLGLYMVKSQIIAMGGKIEVDSEPGKGSTFKVYFKEN